MSEPDRQSDDEPGIPSGFTRSELSGSASDVVQARDVHGGVHFHGSASSDVPSTPHQLPGDVRGFVNRLPELERLDRILAGDPAEPLVVGVSVITGTAGVGKTSLALRWAHRVRDRFPDGQLYANLHGYDAGPPLSPEQVLDHFLRALGVPPPAIPADLEARAALYRSLLAERRVLILLDNAMSERQVRPLLPGTADSLVIVTSRSHLSGLAVRDGARHVTLDVLAEDEAVFLIQSVTTDERFGDSPEELVELARLCARLPLALRIASVRAMSRPRMSLRELMEDLRDESSLWDVLATGDDEQSEAVRTVFAWSYRALPEDAARLFRLLGLHPGPDFGAEAAAALANIPVSRARRLLDVLVGAYVVEQGAPGRYQLHDLMRAYAAAQAQRDETEEICQTVMHRIVVWYLHAAKAAMLRIDSSPSRVTVDQLPADMAVPTFSGRPAALHWFEAEQANLLAAVRAAEVKRLDHVAWQLSAVLGLIYADLNTFDDWFVTGEIGLNAASRLGDRHAEADLLDNLAMAFTQASRPDDGTVYRVRALTIRRELGDAFGVAESLNGLGLLSLRCWRLEEARSYFQQSLTEFQMLEETAKQAVLTSNLARVNCDLGRPAEAEELAQQALAVFREHGLRRGESNSLRILSMIHREQGQPERAYEFVNAALAITDALDDRVAEGYYLLELGAVQRALSQPTDALASYHRSGVIHRRIGDRSREALAWDGTGLAYQQLRRPDEAAAFHRQAAATHRALADHWHLALSLDHLAAALHDAGRTDDARPHWNEALALLAAYDDPTARRTRERIEQNLRST